MHSVKAGRPEKLTDEMKRQITSWRRKSKRKWNAPAIRGELRVWLKNKYPGISQTEIEQKLPGVSRIQKFLKEVEPNLDKEPPQDKPWQLGSPENNSLSGDALVAIFEVQSWLESIKDEPNLITIGVNEWIKKYTHGRMTTGVWPLTVREAGWIAKLYRFNYRRVDPDWLQFLAHDKQFLVHDKIEHRPKDPTNRLIDNPAMLWLAAKAYADYQRLCELAGTPFDTTRLDQALRAGNLGRAKYELFCEYEEASQNNSA